MTMRDEDFLGKKFKHLTIIGLKREIKKPTCFHCVCICGRKLTAIATNVKRGNTTSCGCMKNFKHGLTNTPIRSVWRGMWQRCTNPKAEGYENYGGRGITVDPAWKDLQRFYDDMGDAPPSTTLDRIDVNGPYTKDNCKWSTWTEQHRNRRDNNNITAFGKTQCLTAWAEEYKIPVSTLKNRLYRAKMLPEDALRAPLYAKQRGSA